MIEPIVCVPARNESKRLPALLRSLQQQTWFRGNNRSLQTVLVLNNCDDNSRAVAQRSAPDLPGVSLHLIEVQFASENAHVGSAQRPSRCRQEIPCFLPQMPTQYRVTIGLKLTSVPSRAARTLWLDTLWGTSKRRRLSGSGSFGALRGTHTTRSLWTGSLPWLIQ